MSPPDEYSAQKLELKVAGSSVPKSLAGAIAKGVIDNKDVSLILIGAGPSLQVLKAMCIARSMTAVNGIDLSFIPGFEIVVNPERQERTAIRIYVRASRGRTLRKVTELGDSRPHFTFQDEFGDVHVIPQSFFEDVVNGKSCITDLDQYTKIVPIIIREWLGEFGI